jgi:hypothetical protein
MALERNLKKEEILNGLGLFRLSLINHYMWGQSMNTESTELHYPFPSISITATGPHGDRKALFLPIAAISLCQPGSSTEVNSKNEKESNR